MTKSTLKKISIAVAVLAFCFLFFLASQYYKSHNNPSAATDNEMVEKMEMQIKNLEPLSIPDLTFTTADGKAVNVSDYKGKLTIINFWATWCHICQDEMPGFNNVYNSFKDNDKVNFMMVNVSDGKRETPEIAKKYLDENNFSLPLFVDDKGSMFYSLGLPGLPTTFFINGEGKLLPLNSYIDDKNPHYAHIGPLSEDLLTEIIKGELEK